MTKKQAIAIITKCAKEYQQYLEGNQVLFVYRDECNHSNYTAVIFRRLRIKGSSFYTVKKAPSSCGQ